MAEENLLRHQVASVHDYGPAMVSREVGEASLPGGTRYYLIFARLEPLRGDLSADQRASLSAKLRLMYKHGMHMHGDLHTGNVLVKADGALVFSDFDLGDDISKNRAHMVNRQLQNELGLIADGMRPRVMTLYGRPRSYV
jgi:hypothetical protein